MNICAAGHQHHESRIVDTTQGPFHVWDWERYMGFRGYCSGQDEVSKALSVNREWEGVETARLREVLSATPGCMIDFGAHVGWFTVLASTLGRDVVAVEADLECCRLLSQNLSDRKLENRVRIVPGWVDPHFSLDLPDGPLAVVKADLEGNEQWAVEAILPALQAGRVQHLLLEFSPCFNDSYPALAKRLSDLGYDAYRGRWPWMVNGHLVGSWDFHQDNLWWRLRP